MNSGKSLTYAAPRHRATFSAAEKEGSQLSGLKVLGRWQDAQELHKRRGILTRVALPEAENTSTT